MKNRKQSGERDSHPFVNFYLPFFLQMEPPCSR
jgi:hypothetical protein